MYLSGIVGMLVLIFAVLLLFGVVPMSEKVVGGLFVALSIACFGPWIDRRVA